ncbi:isochorismate synthase [Oscillatoria sp. FACHB-1406]|uniref:isochorismate synthase n=1 Tax=Oscillatoria sp. FACHB-1406 TaxID=2692846 RepID=UPI00168352BB|nr:isochorismate synthase [Oscillatoria sp. FACHB-1406]MBD2576162.1 isochorismate synthase [Oscillatoria sp. FACHB-1406]
MPALPCRANLFQGDRELYRFLLNCQEQSLRKRESVIVSWSQEIELIDPLAVLQVAIQLSSKAWHFYWENAREEEAVFAFETAHILEIETGERFLRSKEFVRNCLKQIVRTGEESLPWAGPHFFANFTFFEGRRESGSPFPSATLVLPEFQVARRGNRATVTYHFAIDDRANLEAIFERRSRYFEWIESGRKQHSGLLSRSSAIAIEVPDDGAERFAKAVKSALHEIDRDRYSKIVLARALEVVSPVPFQLAESIDNLRRDRPDCYIFSASNGRGINFIGASPERLMCVRDRQFIADALAGSAPRGGTPGEDSAIAQKLLHGEKERREHEAVSDFIDRRLQELGLQPARSPLQLLQLPNIQHLRTTFQGQVPDRIHPLDIVAKLHPTPAMAGVPTAAACERIRRYEPCDRSLYAAPLGWIDGNGNGEFIVGIRSAFIQGDRARLYAGAGIVAGSDPHKELAEVQLKLQTILKALA